MTGMRTSSAPSRDPASSRPALHRALLAIGSFGPIGHLPASGTVAAAAVGIPAYWVLAEGIHATPILWAAVIVVFCGLSVAVHDVGDRMLGEKDSRVLVWDEVAGYLIAVAFLPWSWQLAVGAWVLERVFDILKVPPANWVEKRCPGGWGVVGDDVIAGIYARVIIAMVLAIRPGAAGLA
ncbi:MAG: hypothetical protein FLDDKLPJ_00614 [Phycisphaerae bacterium]|nr:hypothetical protein [Phycisphaerae bacterium]